MLLIKPNAKHILDPVKYLLTKFVFLGSLWITTPTYSACDKHKNFPIIGHFGVVSVSRLYHGWDWGTMDIITKLQSFFASLCTPVHLVYHGRPLLCQSARRKYICFLVYSCMWHGANLLQVVTICSHPFKWKRAEKSNILDAHRSSKLYPKYYKKQCNYFGMIRVVGPFRD